MRKIWIFLVGIIFLASCSLLPGTNKTTLKLPSPIRQWAASASASDAYGGLYGQNRDDQSPYAATGAPDVEKCEDSQKAWVIGQEDDGVHWLELNYDTEVYVSEVNIKENFGTGAIIKVEAMDNGQFRALWEGKDLTKACPGTFMIKYHESAGNLTKDMTSYKTSTIRITLDTDKSGWNEIDAVEVVGYDQRWFAYNNTLVYE